MNKSLKTTTGRCKLCGRFFFCTNKTRPHSYCGECGEWAKREANKLRQAAYRQRQREAKATNQKGPSVGASRPALVGRADAVAARIASPAIKGGLYADRPEPERTDRRRKVGLK